MQPCSLPSHDQPCVECSLPISLRGALSCPSCLLLPNSHSSPGFTSPFLPRGGGSGPQGGISFCSQPSPPSSEFIRSPVCFSVSPPQGKLSLIHGHSQGPSTGLTWNQQPRATCQIGFHKSRVSNLRFPHCLCLARSFSPTPLHFPAGPPYQATLDMA